VKSGDFLVNCGASLGIRDSAVVSGNLEHNNPGELRYLTPNKARAFHGHRNRLSAYRLRPAEFLHKEPVEVKLLEAVAHPAEIESHACSVFL
jgi:hypothetical protein